MFDYYKEKLELEFSICWSQSSPNLFTWKMLSSISSFNMLLWSFSPSDRIEIAFDWK